MKFNYENLYRKSPKPLWFRTFLRRYLNRFALLKSGHTFDTKKTYLRPFVKRCEGSLKRYRTHNQPLCYVLKITPLFRLPYFWFLPGYQRNFG